MPQKNGHVLSKSQKQTYVGMINKKGTYYDSIEPEKDNEVGSFFNGIFWLLVAVVSVIVIYVLIFKK